MRKKPRPGYLYVIIDFNRKSSDHIESPSSLFVGELVSPPHRFLLQNW